jgi:hypothetical protein
MDLLQLRDQVAEAIMLELTQQGMGYIGRHIAPASAFSDLGGKPLWNGGGQLLCTGCFTHGLIIPPVGFSLLCSREIR